MTGLKVKISARTVGKLDTFFLDGWAIFRVVAWPSNGTIGSLVENWCNIQVKDCRCLAYIWSTLWWQYQGSD